MSEYAVMPLRDYVDTCDTIREKTGITDVIKSGKMADQINEVYKAGQIALLKNSKYMNATKSGAIISVNDVSPIEHNLDIKLTSDTITDFSGVTVTRCGKNLFDLNNVKTSSTNLSKSLTKTENGFSFKRISQNATSCVSADIYLPIGNYRIKGECMQSDGLKAGWGILKNGSFIINLSSQGTINHTFKITEARVYSLNFYCSYSSPANTTAIFENIQLECGSSATEYEPYIKPQTATANADGTVEGITSLSPNMTLFTDTDGVSINCQYYRDIDLYIDNLITDIALTGGE